MLQSILQSVFGCAHRRTTFPLTPVRRTQAIWAPAVGRTDTYVVCLDCGREFAYNWKEMRVGQPVHSAEGSVTAHSEGAHTVTA